MSATDTAGITPAQILANFPALTPEQAAYCLGWKVTRGACKGEPNRQAVLNEIAAGKIALIDPDAPRARWTISAARVSRHLAGDRTALLPDREQVAA